MLYGIKKYNKSDKPIKKASQIAKIIQSIIISESEIDRAKEHLFVIGLNPAYKIKYIELCSLGTVDSSLVNKREILVSAIKKNCPYLIIAHNHPSNSLTPSEKDLLITNAIGTAAYLVDIILVDHIIVTEIQYFSFVNSNLIWEYNKLLTKIKNYMDKTYYKLINTNIFKLKIK